MEGATYFVTWRLRADQAELTRAERAATADTLRYSDGSLYQLAGYVVMNDHVHVVVAPIAGRRLEAIVQAWKSYTAHRFTLEGSRTGAVWQDEYFDRVLRSEMELTEKLEYILGNPFRRWPELDSYPWLWVAG
ncbi:MAG: transposase [Candidatus Binataceae bacterium]